MNLAKLNIFKRLTDFVKYGRIVHESKSTGNVIRRKYNNSLFSKSGIDSVKTVLDKDGNVLKKLNRQNDNKMGSYGNNLAFTTDVTSPKVPKVFGVFVRPLNNTSYVIGKTTKTIEGDAPYRLFGTLNGEEIQFCLPSETTTIDKINKSIVTKGNWDEAIARDGYTNIRKEPINISKILEQL